MKANRWNSATAALASLLIFTSIDGRTEEIRFIVKTSKGEKTIKLDRSKFEAAESKEDARKLIAAFKICHPPLQSTRDGSYVCEEGHPVMVSASRDAKKLLEELYSRSHYKKPKTEAGKPGPDGGKSKPGVRRPEPNTGNSKSGSKNSQPIPPQKQE